MGKILDTLHVEVHSLRNISLQTNIPPTIFEQKVNKIIAEAFANECSECRQTAERLKYQQPQIKQSWLGRVFG